MSDEFELHLIYITPAPIFARLERFDDRVIRFVEVFCRVLVLRGVAATHVTTRHTEPQMNPRITHLQTFLASAGVRFDVLNLVDVLAYRHILAP